MAVCMSYKLTRDLIISLYSSLNYGSFGVCQKSKLLAIEYGQVCSKCFPTIMFNERTRKRHCFESKKRPPPPFGWIKPYCQHFFQIVYMTCFDDSGFQCCQATNNHYYRHRSNRCSYLFSRSLFSHFHYTPTVLLFCLFVCSTFGQKKKKRILEP